MLTKEAIMEIKILSRQGMSIRAISRKLGGGTEYRAQILAGRGSEAPGSKRSGAAIQSALEGYDQWREKRAA
ncbi:MULTISPECIES: hypothetical protein [Marinobacter]|jgi:hypothetical protein|uniref:hypothetical protein n=1 Tax=Marinobacter TaxID=2742 RepID=UPI0029423B42|nr:hypothetical protein [Marinobacter salarius]MCG2582661.1 hypothetical protein [Marinobacter sp.]WOI17963.1 hypothetical protein R1T46_14335 [Marinobacter salarius]